MPLLIFYLDVSHPFTRLFFARLQTLPSSQLTPLSKAYVNLLYEMGHLEAHDSHSWSSPRRSVASPSSILDTIRISYPMFRGVFQHDSQEFMRAFLSDLHDELKFKPFDESKFPPISNSCCKFRILDMEIIVYLVFHMPFLQIDI